MNGRLYLAKQLNRALQFYAQDKAAGGADDSTIMEIADLYPDWKAGIRYSVGTIVKYGVNGDGETQLYRVAQEHTSQADWLPGAGTESLYTAIGFAEDGVPIWTQPFTYDDAYEIGDIVEHDGKRWQCEQGNATGASGPRNTYEPGVWGWSEVTG